MSDDTVPLCEVKLTPAMYQAAHKAFVDYYKIEHGYSYVGPSIMLVQQMLDAALSAAPIPKK